MLVIHFNVNHKSYFNYKFIFILIITVGFVFELGKSALKIESKQTKVLIQKSENFGYSDK